MLFSECFEQTGEAEALCERRYLLWDIRRENRVF